jgi:imidazolonepropionase-like amidohydrolase
MINKVIRFLALLIFVDANAQTAITNVTIVDVTNYHLINRQSVLVEGNKIKTIAPSEKFKVPANARIIDGTDKFLMPGLIDAHAHPWDGDMYSDDGIDLTNYKSFQNAIDESKDRLETNYKRFLQCGITTVFSPGTTISTFKISDSLAKRSIMPSLYMAGKLICVSDFGNPHNLPPEDEYFDYAENVDAAKNIVQKQLKLHPSFIKILFVPDLTWQHIEDSARSKYPIVKAIIDEAHRNGLKVAVHATERITAQLAVQAGCDYLAHGVHDEVVGDDFISLLKQKQTILCPTSNVEYPILRAYTQNPPYTTYELQHANPFVVKTFFDLQDLDSALFRKTKLRRETSKAIYKRDSIRLINLKKLSDAGVPIVAGTDVGSLGDMPAASYLPELLKMKQGGMDNWQIIRAATFSPTVFINKQNALGTIATGKIADMILLNKNPVDALENLNDVALVFKNGIPISPDTLINESPEMAVQRLWNAYNAKNSEAFFSCIAPGIKIYTAGHSSLSAGLKQLHKEYSFQLQKESNLHCEVKSRIVSGDTVVDKILFKEAGKITKQQIIGFKINAHKINGITFIN